MRVLSCATHPEAREKVRSGEADITIVGNRKTGVATVYQLGAGVTPPDSLKALPGFRYAGVSGVPAQAVQSYTVTRLAEEVAAALEQLV